jgi:NAD(P)-dependent dehydrogenase (short-subunit alcohol dehydrogenase family)
MVADVNVAGAEETAAAIREQGGQADFVRADVSLAADVQAMVAATVQRFGRLDCAHNNAGVLGAGGAFIDISEAQWDRIIDINLKGVFLCLQQEIRHMLEHGGGAIVNTASVAGLRPAADDPPYSASKYGVVSLTQTAARSYSARGIRINAVCPGFVDTPMIAGMFETDAAKDTFMQRMHPIGRGSRPEEIAAAVVWLCSDAASFITGVVLPVDGGFLTRF